MHPRSLAPVLVVSLLTLSSLAGCGGESPEVSGAAGESGSAAPVESDLSLQMREVTTTNITTGTGAPTSVQQTQLDSFDCTEQAPTPPAEDEMVACDEDGTTYLLEPAAVDGGVESAQAAQDTSDQWVVDVVLGPDSAQRLADLSGSLVGTADQLALVLDGRVLAAPTVNSRLTSGELQISGDFTEAEATDLAEQIQAGA